MPDLQVRLVGKTVDQRLTAELCCVDAQDLVLTVSGHRSRRVTLDGVPRRLSSGATGLLSLDLKRSTGYHRLEVDRNVFWFGTEDRKLGLSGVSTMLKELGRIGTGWTGQVIFSDGTGYRDAHVLYGWLDQWADTALDAIESVFQAPRMANELSTRLSRRGGASVLTVATIRYLRSDPRRHLVAREGGLLRVGDARYDPTRVVARKRQLTVQTIPNRRAVQLLDLLAKVVDETLGSELNDAAQARCRLWLSRIGTIQARPLARSLRGGPNVLSSERQTEELNDRRYRHIFEVARDLRAQFGWSARGDEQRRYSYVQAADRIYQAYAVSRLAAELGLRQSQPVLGSTPLAFRGSDYDIYYDSPCPPDVLRSWRRGSVAPDASKPDVLLVERATGRVALLDAKYRVGVDGYASEDSRKEVAAYMALYGLSTATILYPGQEGSFRAVSGHGQRILEIPVRPGSNALRASLNDVLGTLADPRY
jgi:hypothetical protein